MRVLFIRLPLTALLSLIVLAGPALASGGKALSVRDGFSSHPLAPFMDWVRDPAGDWSAGQAARARGWSPLSGFTLKKGERKGVIWFRLRLGATGEAPPLFLEICTHQPEKATVYAPLRGPNQGWAALMAGWGHNERNDETGFLTTVVKLPRRMDPSRPLLLRWEDPFITEPRPVLYSERAFLHMSWQIMAFKFAIYGVMLAMILYNLFLSLFLRDRAYLMYVLYMTAMLLYQATVRGEVKFLSVAAYQALYSHVLLLSTGATVLGLQFARTFLGTRRHLPRLDKVLLGLMGLFLLTVAGLDLVGYRALANRASFVIVPLAIVAVLGAAALRRRQGFGSAIYFLLAWSFLSLGVLVYLMYGLGLVFSSPLTVHAAGLGAAVESLLLSLALADRIRRLQSDREALLQRQHGLARQAITDELTGLYNKRFMWSALQETVKFAHRNGQPLSVVVLDVDHFKRFNDSHGHPKGDEVLAAVGREIRNSVRDGDKGCRYGGEEFVIILPGADPKRALAVAERVRRALAARSFQVGEGQRVGITASAGVACLQAGEEAAELINRADKALYAAKNAGRDRAVLPG